ncbi:MAG: radical SAM family heme chaperone HemW [Planctomycetes bacterium]|nr:radical SAM family heme chaperone HemW [Planctomycetota bacterium]
MKWKAESKAGLYLHVPFCRKRCPFCDFAISCDLSKASAWEEAIGREAARWAGAWGQPFDTVYFGGGTPSLLEPERLERILGRLRATFEIDGQAEVTLEANPGTLGPAGLSRLFEIGVNRLSLGVQSFDEGDLILLGREHGVADSLNAFRWARQAGFRNQVIDLIYGLPGRSAEHWREQLRRAIELGPEHISAYMLTYEPGTAFTRRKERGEFREPPEGEALELFLMTREELEKGGYEHYEISSFARPGFQSRHNRKYWEGAPYLGLGPSAHSFRDPERFWNYPRLKDYLDALAAGRSPIAGGEILSREEKRFEQLFLGLRTSRGLELEEFYKEFGEGEAARQRPVLEGLVESGLAVWIGSRFRLTARGLAVADGLAVKLA